MASKPLNTAFMKHKEALQGHFSEQYKQGMRRVKAAPTLLSVPTGHPFFGFLHHSDTEQCLTVLSLAKLLNWHQVLTRTSQGARPHPSKRCLSLSTSCTEKITQGFGSKNQVKEHGAHTSQPPPSVPHVSAILNNNLMNNFKLPCSCLMCSNEIRAFLCIYVGISLPQAQTQMQREQSTTHSHCKRP